ncbi:hypothetical protein MLOOGBEN_18745 [Bacillus sp. EB106-08-02-XG196]|uniref:CBO0543 family protein n=1 Tax=Bacillus sp. EB106-08-02-XG196 TaxID=2737049 RepID=UPI0015C4D7B7|nr:CBO0543 family protein [Bacillus sp. EB106-08-02-XG196]NWQ42745.1 hypothetical protein [Bacillus sp. EB106-08-02-XG196]
MLLLYVALFLFAALKWGDWRNWRDYYPTILFFMIGDLLKNFIFYNHWMWTYKETMFLENILRNHTIINLMIIFIGYPSTIFLFLGRFPNVRWKQGLWISFWVFLYSILEYINLHYLYLIRHHNGWSMTWSVIFNIVMFPMFFIHHKKPLFAWILSAIWILFLLKMFPIPLEKMK